MRRRFGHSCFRAGQDIAISAVLAGRDTLAVMPTGGGKSLCYQLPAVLLGGTTLVVSPLVALMRDQVANLRARGIEACFINSSLGGSEQRDRITALADGRFRLVYVAPERFRQPAFLEGVARSKITLFAIDEAHCISAWGHQFRPDYLNLPQGVAICGNPTVLATTATATSAVRADIAQQLGLNSPLTVSSCLERPNLHYVVQEAAESHSKWKWLLRILARVPGSAIIYAATRNNVELTAAFLVDRGHSAVAYHAGMSDTDRSWSHDSFMTDRARIIVATNAFGMGIDKDDVRSVIHCDLPGTLEAYYQESGRAGRDGHPAYCTLLFSAADRYLHEFLINRAFPNPTNEHRLREMRGLAEMVAYAKNRSCRRNALLGYFGEIARGSCGRCDVCLGRCDHAACYASLGAAPRIQG